MWKKQLQISTRISSILSRAITSKDSSSSVSNSHNYSSSIFFSSSCLLGRTEGKPFPSAGGLYFRNPGGIFTRGSFADLFVKNDNFYCSQSKSAERFHCWNCGAEAESATPFLFCRACRSVQSVDESIDYFQIFGLGRKYKIEVEELEKKYKDWQKMLHPDLVHSKSQVKLEGILVDEEERITDPELLAEVMELREAVDEAEDSRALNEIQAQLQEKLRYWSDAFDDAYVRGNYEDALASIRRMTYYRRANEEIVKKL
ncbi:iron-sulfur cluster co-chaperone protein HscB, mitochondrial isoform X2 [Sesamum indicum]|uniref:Iron-sulfur cluster co-chaperone protein HscB, mitochondrial isoform X2 n=1 Tax=Sesamum indicum TaxID=4182 RepID=A0A8M8V3Z9_SESIN|nr:iron-sulfur cluster co-chaperone protein HscB, mitochondrial isoform X2 [Sesamum indicum]